MQVWYDWMVTHWTSVPEHHSLEIRPLAAVFTLLTVTKKKKKPKKGNPEKTQPPTPTERAAWNSELCPSESSQNHLQPTGQHSYNGPLNWFPDRCCLMEGLELAASPSFRQTTCEENIQGGERKAGIKTQRPPSCSRSLTIRIRDFP